MRAPGFLKSISSKRTRRADARLEDIELPHDETILVDGVHERDVNDAVRTSVRHSSNEPRVSVKRFETARIFHSAMSAHSRLISND
jgi:hypothetical protein